ncbi:hypothetical protein C7T35_15530 [Variovorax sp. WS11]|uniref:hypothetical protein n=1 Tax=Variovorax sp. WS11 TaxID=1105204 RepID=UPI000D0CF46C|nr:hypothetical protein [Variovorax sp. WS11]NDZ12025.1 hypothetical protein [Variovorax sp. WS11]PSL83789.1 hypothetical protein C7T35_15530 [Variovorax sp. WS11]
MDAKHELILEGVILDAQSEDPPPKNRQLRKRIHEEADVLNSPKPTKAEVDQFIQDHGLDVDN